MKRLSLLCIAWLISGWVFGQVTYSGNVIDAIDKKYMKGVEVRVGNREPVITNERGHFSLKANAGDTLKINFPGFVAKRLVLGLERILLIEIQDQARLLPTFEVRSELFRYRFQDGRLVLVKDEPEGEKPLSRQATTASDKSSLYPNFSIYGPISYFTRRNRQLRKYEEKLDTERRRAGYLAVIDSDSIRRSLMEKYQMDRKSWDEMIIRFNEFHRAHQFLDWSSQRVLAQLSEFIRLETYLED
ncbi:peptidase associated/transthyretin-like domain-containing protein [Algoriphagus taiwanensis]|uniref:CarboxypepD_reg-like domain-containing protein n=1 Tax=Algoriphagus taiwanensis TaxID=1445656 RepID=A0ABQ6Q5S0_9BACT|nr:hypothetical protein Ataiwa_36910 [Algoriphagus taiwanensis]